MHNHDTVTDSLLDGGEVWTIQEVVTARQPDGDVPGEELAWWLALQERLTLDLWPSVRGQYWPPPVALGDPGLSQLSGIDPAQLPINQSE
jgi:hypothetical protein